VRILEHLALVAALAGNREGAARLLGYTVAFYAAGAGSREFTELATYNRLIAELGRELTQERIAALMAEGAAWSEDEAADAAIRS
jgi:hypothetical protein